MSEFQISFTEQDIKRQNARKRPKQGWYLWRVAGVQRKVAKTGTMYMTENLLAVDEDGNVRGPKGIRNTTFLPNRTPIEVLTEIGGFEADAAQEVAENQRPPQTARLINNRLVATMADDFAPLPTKERGTNMYAHNDDLIDYETKLKVDSEIIQGVGAFCANWFNEPDLTVGHEFLGRLVHNEQYNNIAEIRAELPEGATIVDLNDCMDTVE